MKLLSYKNSQGEARAGVLVGDVVYDCYEALMVVNNNQAPTAEPTVLSLLNDWDSSLRLIEELDDSFEATRHQISGAMIGKLDDVKLLAPILYPPAIFCTAANYMDHVTEMGGEAFDKSEREPYFFLKSPQHTLLATKESVHLPAQSKSIDWEAEIVVVIGRSARNVSADDAMDYVAGYTMMNDVSARDLFMRQDWPRFPVDWFSHKNFETSAPMGPWITLAKDIDNPHSLDIKLWVNDEIMQDSNSSFLIYNISDQIEYLSKKVTLRPGDVIATGTPAGVGRPRGLSLKPGDFIRVQIEGLGQLENTVSAP